MSLNVFSITQKMIEERQHSTYNTFVAKNRINECMLEVATGAGTIFEGGLTGIADGEHELYIDAARQNKRVLLFLCDYQKVCYAV